LLFIASFPTGFFLIRAHLKMKTDVFLIEKYKKKYLDGKDIIPTQNALDAILAYGFKRTVTRTG